MTTSPSDRINDDIRSRMRTAATPRTASADTPEANRTSPGSLPGGGKAPPEHVDPPDASRWIRAALRNRGSSSTGGALLDDWRTE
jgi:hypothetical protein